MPSAFTCIKWGVLDFIRIVMSPSRAINRSSYWRVKTAYPTPTRSSHLIGVHLSSDSSAVSNPVWSLHTGLVVGAPMKTITQSTNHLLLLGKIRKNVWNRQPVVGSMLVLANHKPKWLWVKGPSCAQPDQSLFTLLPWFLDAEKNLTRSQFPDSCGSFPALSTVHQRFWMVNGLTHINSAYIYQDIPGNHQPGRARQRKQSQRCWTTGTPWLFHVLDGTLIWWRFLIFQHLPRVQLLV